MTFIPTPLPPPPSLFTPGIYILQYDNQQIIGSGLTPFTFRSGIYEISSSNYPTIPSSPAESPFTASNDITNEVNSNLLYQNSCWCTLDNPIGPYFPLSAGIQPYSIYKYVGTPSNFYYDPTVDGPITALDWTLITTLSSIGAGAWFTCYLSSQILVWDETQLVNPPISASLSGSFGFVQITSSAAKITLTCVETSSTDPSGGKWIISNTATETKLY